MFKQTHNNRAHGGERGGETFIFFKYQAGRGFYIQ